jgi:hypothetical protein
LKDTVIGKKRSDEEKLANLFREQGSEVKHKEVTSDPEVGKGEYTWDAKHVLEELPHFEEIPYQRWKFSLLIPRVLLRI